MAARTSAKPAQSDDSGKTVALAIASLLAGIPITAIAATHGASPR